MNGISFGKEVKRLRELAYISSRGLSATLGKAPAYVSQLERGLIKKPDYETSYELLKILGVKEDKIEAYLRHFGIDSSKDIESRIKSAEQRAMEEDMKHQANFYGRKLERLNAAVFSINDVLLNFVSQDPEQADKVVTNLLKLMEDEESFSFLSEILEHDLSHVKRKHRSEILRFIAESVHNDNLERLIEKENEK